MVAVSRSIGTIRNVFAPVNKLPAEILARIFKILAMQTALPDPFLPDLSSYTDTLSWIVVCQVCRYWRETALAFPSLWSNIDTHSPLAALALLDRSAASPIHVYLRDAVRSSGFTPCLNRARLLQAIGRHSPRFVELHIQPTFRYGPDLLRSFQNPASNLRALTIMLNMNKDEFQELPPIFDGHIPNLEHLTLANFSKWSINQFGGRLTHVCLLDQPLRRRMPMAEFLDFLASCPRLQELALIDAGPGIFVSPSMPEVDIDRRVCMDCLQSLHIGDWPTPQSIANFLQHLALPANTKIFIWADCLFRREETLSMLFPTNLEHIHPLHRLSTVHLTYRPATRDYPQLLSIQDGALVFYLHFAMPTSQEMMCSMFTPFDLRNVEELTIGIQCNPELSEDAWRSIFKSMPRLRTLHILRRSSRPILAGLSGADASGIAVCPALTLLSISDDRAVSSIRLFLFAEERAQRGTPLQRLQIISRTNMYSYRLDDELQDMRSNIDEVECIEDEQVDIRQLPVGWPTATYRWMQKMREQRGHRTT